MPLFRIAVRVEGAEAVGSVAGILDELTGGVSAFELREPTGAAPAEWAVEAYASKPLLDATLDLQLSLAVASAGGAILDIGESRVPERDWLAENRRQFPPQRICRFFVHGSHWRERAPVGLVTLEIDAATAFGTGEHPSTRGCLIAFDRLSRRHRFRRMRDIGTGSGILAIAAAKVRHRPVMASDIDPEAVRVTRHHARRNGVAGLVRLRCAAGAGYGAGYELVFANILARPLARMARDLSRVVMPGGYALLSGLLRRQEAGVLAAYRAHRLFLAGRVPIEGWVTLILRRR